MCYQSKKLDFQQKGTLIVIVILGGTFAKALKFTAQTDRRTDRQVEYQSVLACIVDHPALLHQVTALPLCVFDGLNDSHQRDVVTRGRTAGGGGTKHIYLLSLCVCISVCMYVYVPDGPAGLIQVGVVQVAEVTWPRFQQESPLCCQGFIHVIQQAAASVDIMVIQATLHHDDV